MVVYVVRNDGSKSPIPDDVMDVFRTLRTLRSELSDSMMCDIEEPMHELAMQIQDWKKDCTKVPSWDAFRSSINDACRNDGMPVLFDEA